MQNMAAIKVARRQHKETCSDADGYDLIAVPEVSACGKFARAHGLCAGCPDTASYFAPQGAVTNHASKKIRIFTKQEYRRV